MHRSIVISGLLVMFLGSATGCATRQAMSGQEAKGFDRKLSAHAYIEDGKNVTIVVDTLAARDKDGQPYLPFEISVANHGYRMLTLSRESFTLSDKDGKRYPMATAAELFEGYEMLDFDRGMAELEGILFNRYGAKTRYQSNFSPIRSGPISRSNIVRDLVEIPRHGYMIDFIYFPMPASGVRGQPFELFIDAPELEEPVFVKFEVR